MQSLCSADRERCGCIPYRTQTSVIWGMKRGENVPCHCLCAASHKPVPTMRIHFGNISNDRLLSLLKCSQGRFLNFIAFDMTGNPITQVGPKLRILPTAGVSLSVSTVRYTTSLRALQQPARTVFKQLHCLTVGLRVTPLGHGATGCGVAMCQTQACYMAL